MEIHPITVDHGVLLGLDDDDHVQYLLANGTRALAGAWDMGSRNLTNVNIDSGTVDAITSLTVANNVDIGNYTLTANGLTIDGTFTDGTLSIVGGSVTGLTIGGNWTAAGHTCADLGTVTTADINGGTLDGVAIAADCTQAEWDAAYTHISNNGSDHSFIDQSVVSGAAPTFTADNFSDGGNNAIVTTTQETNWDNHIADNTQAHSDYLLNNASDETSGTLTAAGFTTAGVYTSVNDTLSATDDFFGIKCWQTKTAGDTDEADDFWGGFVRMTINHDDNIGYMRGFGVEAILSSGKIGDATHAKNLIGNYQMVDCDAGYVYGNVYGLYTNVDLEAAMDGISGSVFGHYIQVDADQSPAGFTYGLYINALTNVDYVIRTNGGAPVLFDGDLDVSGLIECDEITYDTTDPQLETFYPVTKERALDLLRYSTPPDKRGGVSIYFNKDRKQLELYQDGKIYKFLLNEVETVGEIKSKAFYEDKFKFDKTSGEVIPNQRPQPRYKVKDGFEFDKDTGKFYEMVEQDDGKIKIMVRGNEVDKEQAIEMRKKVA